MKYWPGKSATNCKFGLREMSKIKLRQFQEIEIHKNMNFASQFVESLKRSKLKAKEIGENE